MAWNCDTCAYRKSVVTYDLELDCCSNPEFDKYFGMQRACPGYENKIVEKEKLISFDKACKWLRANIDLYADTRRSLFSNYQEVYLTDNFETEFRKAMEE